MPGSFRPTLWHVTVATLALGACGDDTLGPAKPADPMATAASIQALDASFSSPTFQSFTYAATYSPAAAGALAPLRTVLRAAQPTLVSRRALSPEESRLAAASLAAALVPSGAVSASVLPPSVLGVTYEWNGTTYADLGRAGAPPTGVRFILYALDGGGVPITAQEIGYADLIDESSGSTDALHLLVVGTTTGSPITYLDYRVSATAGATAGSAAVVGFITDGTHRLDFNVALTATASRITVDIRFDVNADDAHVRLRITLSAPDQNTLRLAIDFRLQFGTEVVTVRGTTTLDATTGNASGTVTVGVNGGIYATITETNDSRTYTGGGGQELTADDLTALSAILDAVGTTLGRFDELFAPAGSAGV